MLKRGNLRQHPQVLAWGASVGFILQLTGAHRLLPDRCRPSRSGIPEFKGTEAEWQEKKRKLEDVMARVQVIINSWYIKPVWMIAAIVGKLVGEPRRLKRERERHWARG